MCVYFISLKMTTAFGKAQKINICPLNKIALWHKNMLWTQWNIDKDYWKDSLKQLYQCLKIK